MKLTQVNEQEIIGMSIRTKNTDEMNQKTSKIGKLWQSFYETIVPNLKEGSDIFGVYYDYESDATGEFNVLAGTDKIQNTTNLESIKIQEGSYLMFANKGEMPQVVIDTWSEIWNYFASDNSKYKRIYTTDFELYKSTNEIEIYIAVQ